MNEWLRLSHVSNSEIKGTLMEFLEKINENKRKEKNSFLLHEKHKKTTVRAGLRF